MAQFVHDELADLTRRHFALAESAQAMRDARDRSLHFLLLDGALLQRFQQSAAQFLFIERFATAMALDDQRHHELGRLEGRESLAAGETLAPTPNLLPLGRQTRVVHLGLLVAAEGTVHGGVPSAQRSAQRPSTGSSP